MAHYAFLDKNNYVVEVIVGKDENELIDGFTPEEFYGRFRQMKCVRTSYNGKIRANFAGIGYFYDDNLDVFIPPRPFDSWILEEQEFFWKAPKPYPNDGNFYIWNEEILEWIDGETL